MKRIVTLCCILLSLGLLQAIASLPGSGASLDTGREYSFAYHGGTDDLHWYGSPQWAVLFDFRAAYPSLSVSQFEINSAIMYFPVTGHNAKVELFTDFDGQPQQRVGIVEQVVTSNQMQFNFPTSVQAEKVWLILTYNTTYLGPYVPASLGGGTRSYYLNQLYDVPFFQSMSIAGFNCEFLFGLKGDFLISNQDLELKKFELVGDFNPRSVLRPSFTIYNHSNQTISQAQMNIQISSPTAAEFSISDNIQIQEAIPPRSEYVFNPTSPAYSAHRYDLDARPMQIKARGILASELGAADTLFNNTKTRYYNIFDNLFPIYPVENFISNQHTVPILTHQSQYPVDDLHSLVYFPILSDSLSSIGAYQRSQWYSLFSTPVTVIGGVSRINGLRPGYPQEYEQKLEILDSFWSFVGSSSCTMTLPSQGENLSIRIELQNPSTFLFRSNLEPNLMGNSRLYAAFFKRYRFEDMEAYVFDRWIAYADTISSTPAPGTSVRKDYTTSLSNLDLIDLTNNYRLYYWLQDRSTYRYYYAAFQEFQNFLDNSQELAPTPLHRVYPNPLRGNRDIHIELDPKLLLPSLRIYNIRGQLIYHSSPQPGAKNSLASTIFPSTGIYFLQIEGKDSGGKKQNTSTKISVIK